ncbi:MAG: NUDIX domain-containing protein [Candidatus Moranbacteria bacterium]|jgi:8-oxo-dGTP pyrophosphatase MutT (NUDIX family)|nr:NUDIX domain-containing protein [Candidatus Moranbacteria bacterium]
MKRLKCNIGEYGVIVNQRGEFLILRLPLNKEFTKEMWMLPGGRLDFTDQPELGLQREVLEETGLKIKVLAPIHVARWGIENPPKYSVFFLCQSVSKHDVKISNEHIESKWIKFSDIEKIPWHNINSKIAAKKSKILLSKVF